MQNQLNIVQIGNDQSEDDRDTNKSAPRSCIYILDRGRMLSVYS